MEFEFDWQYGAMAGAIWLIALIPIWGNVPFFSFSDDVFLLKHKIIVSLVLLPICYILIAAVAGRD